MVKRVQAGDYGSDYGLLDIRLDIMIGLWIIMGGGTALPTR